MISTSPIKISCMIARSEIPKAVRGAARRVRARERARAGVAPREAQPARRRIHASDGLLGYERQGGTHRRHRDRRHRRGPIRARARLRALRAAPPAARPARRRPPPDDVQLRPAPDRLHSRRRRRLERPLALRRHLATRDGSARLERRVGAIRRAGLQHTALEPRLWAARLVHAAPAPRRPDHGRRRDGLRRGHGADLHDARHRRRPPDLRPEHAADDEHDRQPDDQGSAADRHRALPGLDRDADPGGAGGAARTRSASLPGTTGAGARASRSARSATAPSGSRRRSTGRSTPTSSRSRATCASAGSWRSAPAASSEISPRRATAAPGKNSL